MRSVLALVLLLASAPAFADGASPRPGNDPKDGMISTPIHAPPPNIQRLDPKPVIYDPASRLIGKPPAKDDVRPEHALGIG